VAIGVALAVNKVGTDGPDSIVGTNGVDNLLGGSGKDVVLGTSRVAGSLKFTVGGID